MNQATTWDGHNYTLEYQMTVMIMRINVQTWSVYNLTHFAYYHILDVCTASYHSSQFVLSCGKYLNANTYIILMTVNQHREQLAPQIQTNEPKWSTHQCN